MRLTLSNFPQVLAILYRAGKLKELPNAGRFVPIEKARDMAIKQLSESEEGKRRSAIRSVLRISRLSAIENAMDKEEDEDKVHILSEHERVLLELFVSGELKPTNSTQPQFAAMSFRVPTKSAV